LIVVTDIDDAVSRINQDSVCCSDLRFHITDEPDIPD
jgi:hypothetical protein